MKKMKLIVGLGNPEEKYLNTRHNIGFWVIEALLRELAPLKKTDWKRNKQLKAEIANIDDLVLAKPLISMNASGIAVKKLISSFQFPASSLWLIHDDLDLVLGKIKIVKSRGAAGHRGVDSVIKSLGSSDFIRFRLGIGQPKKAGKWWVSSGGLTSENVKHQEVIDFVLSKFERKERIEADKMVKKAVEIIQFALEKGIEAAISRFHQ